MTSDYENQELNQGTIEDIIELVNEQLKESKLPEKLKTKIENEINLLKTYTLDSRPARIAIVGRRGAGKSSLINAIFSEKRAEVGDVKAQTGVGKWHTYKSSEGRGDLEILDTRGLGENEEPEEEVSKESPLEEIKASVNEKCPDAILFLNKAKEVSSRLDEDLTQLVELKSVIKEQHGYNVPIIGVVTQVDELSPKSNDKPPFDHVDKQKNIIEAVESLESKLAEAVSNPIKVIPVSSYLEFEGDEIVYDLRWQIDYLIDFLIDQLPNEAQLRLAKLAQVKSVQKKLARKISKVVAGTTGVVGSNPIPVSDLPIITGLQMIMISIIGIIGGRKIGKKEVIEFISALGVNVGVGIALRQVARQLVKIFPGAGNAVSGAMASAGTYALSEAAIAYFIDGKPLTEVKQIYNNVFNRKKKDLDENNE